MTTIPRLRVPEMIAATPYLLGFNPYDAVVVYGLDPHGLLVGTAHLSHQVLVDEDLDTSAEQAARGLAGQGATAVLIAGFETHPQATADGRDVLGWVATLTGLAVPAIWVATGDTCYRVDTDERVEVHVPAPEESAFVTDLIAAGCNPAATRGGVATAWVPTGAVEAAAAATGEQVSRAWDRLLDGDQVSDEHLAAAAAGAARPLTRDALLAAIAGGRVTTWANGITPQIAGLDPATLTDRSGHRAESLERLRQGIIRLQPRPAVPLLAMAAATAWADGDATTAALVCDIALAIDAGCTLARLIATAIQRGLHA